MTRDERQSALLRRWGFKCNCSLCNASYEKLSVSDYRRTRIKMVREEVLELVETGHFHKAIEVHVDEDLLDLIAKEGLLSMLGEHYEILARLYHATGDTKNAEKYGRLALADLKTYGGTDAYDSIKDINGILRRS
jgi:hypothetical protein